MTYLEERMNDDLQTALQNKDEDITMNVSKFYLKANMVVDHPK